MLVVRGEIGKLLAIEARDSSSARQPEHPGIRFGINFEDDVMRQSVAGPVGAPRSLFERWDAELHRLGTADCSWESLCNDDGAFMVIEPAEHMATDLISAWFEIEELEPSRSK